MFVSPSKLKLDRILRGRTLNFETPKKMYSNLVLIPTIDPLSVAHAIDSRLFRPQQLMCFYTPRTIRPMNRKMIRKDQRALYKNIKELSNGRVKFGKVTPQSYGGRNLVYDIGSKYLATYNLILSIHKNSPIIVNKYLKDYMGTLFSEAQEEVHYDKTYIVFVMDKYISDFRKKIFTNAIALAPEMSLEPAILFLKSLKDGTVNYNDYANIDNIIFYNPNADAMVVLGKLTKDTDINNTLLKLIRLNNFNNGTDALDDAEVDDGSKDELDPEDAKENKKEEVKNLVIQKVAKELKANKLNDFEAASKEEQEIAISIDKKVDSFLNNPANKEKTFLDLVDDVQKDKDVKASAIKYVETKRIADTKLIQQTKNVEKEAEIVGSILDIAEETSDKIIEPDNFKVKDVPESANESVLSSMDEEYNKKQAKEDLINVLSSFSNNDYLPMSVSSLEIEDSSNEFNQTNLIKIKYKTDDNRILSTSIDIPKIVDKRYLYLGGDKKTITKQLFRLPIVKTKADRVEITTNYQKLTMERSGQKFSRRNIYIEKILQQYKSNSNFKIEFGSNSISNADFNNDFEFEELADSVSLVESLSYRIIFNRAKFQEEFDLLDFPDYDKENSTPFGFKKVGDDIRGYIFIKDKMIFITEKNENKFETKQIADNMFTFINGIVLGRSNEKLPAIGKSFVFSNVKIFGETYPTFLIVGLMNGLSDILKRYKIKYQISEKRIPKNENNVEVKFKDYYFYYEDTIRNTLLLNILYNMNTDQYNLIDFDTEEPYIRYFIDKLDQPIYIKNTLRTNLGVMVDPITRSVLHDLKLPENIIDLLLLGNTLLMNNKYRPQNDIRNYRIRCGEIIPSVLYYLLADAYVKYQNHSMLGKPNNIDIPRNALVSKLVTEPNINPHSSLNPILEVESIAALSAKGWKGVNLDDAYTLEMRAYDETMSGITSANATPYSGAAGITRSMSFNPKISHVRGYISNIDQKTIDATNILSPAELLSPFTSTQADPPRQAMQAGQGKHIMPVKVTDRQLIGSGINKTIAFMMSDDFCFKAKENGIIEKIDNENHLVLLSYNDGTKDAIDIGDVFEKNSNSGFFIRQRFILVYNEKEKFKKGDVLAYNPSYFKGKGKDVDYCPGTLAKVAIASIDSVYEDSTLISESLSEKCSSLVTMAKSVSLGPNTIIHKIANIGDDIKTNDHLLDFTTSFNDPSTSDFLINISKSLGDDATNIIGQDSITSKYTGKLVNIKIYYNRELEELSPSLRDLIKKYNNIAEKRRKALEGIITPNVKIPTVEKQNTKKIGQEEYDGVYIIFYIEYFAKMAEGDKLTYSTALKGVVSNLVANEEAPLSTYRSEDIIEGILTPVGVGNRMTADIYSILFGNKVLIELGKQIQEIWEDKR